MPEVAHAKVAHNRILIFTGQNFNIYWTSTVNYQQNAYCSNLWVLNEMMQRT